MGPPLSPVSAAEQSPVPTTDRIAEECPRFRILIIGRSGMGKSSLINAIFKTSLADVQHDRAGSANIDEGITSPHNRHLILHDSQGYEPGDVEKFSILERFITERSQREPISERLHAIWLCITAPFSRGRIFETGEEKIFRLNRNKVPIIVVFTKFDLFLASISRRSRGREKISMDVAEKRFKDEHGPTFEKATHNISGKIPYTTVAISLPDTLQQLVEITMQSISESSSQSSRLTRDEDLSDSAQIALAIAQRVDMPAKIAASTRVGEKKYWSAIGSGIGLYGFNLQKYRYAIHKDIVTVWNIRDLDEYFLTEEFCNRMTVVVGDLGNQKCASPVQNTGKGSSSILSKFTSAVYKKLPEHIHFLMAYVVDLTLIQQAVFQVSLQDRTEGKVTQERVSEIIYQFHLSEKKKRIHDTIVGLQHVVARDNMVGQITSLIKENEMTENDRQLDQTRPTLLLLLSILKFEQSVNGLVVNKVILGLFRKVLDLPDYGTIVDELKDPVNDVELLIDFILYALRSHSLLGSDIPDANRRARRLMFKLIAKTDVTLKFMFIADVKIESYRDTLGLGGYGRVIRGDHKGRQVALKMLDKEGTRKKDFCREALAWRSLEHRFILPLSGIFEEKGQQFLVSPLMMNGTLTQWRKNQSPPDVAIIHQLMLEVAEGVRYIHAEGIVHGDLKGDNILLDPSYHCQIADFGLTRHLDATFTQGASSISLNFAAPELFGTCDKCDGSGCDACRPDSDTPRGKRKTKETDVYAFGCLYYTIFFDTFPFQGRDEYQILRLVTSGSRPDRLKSPTIDDKTWGIIQGCWPAKPSERSTMEQIAELLTSPTMQVQS